MKISKTSDLANLTYSPDMYISGGRAMNIIDTVHLTGDWHTIEMWSPGMRICPVHLMGKDAVDGLDTSKYFGYDSIFRADDVLASMGSKYNNIFAATHPRAIADLVTYFAANKGKPEKVVDADYLDDTMPAESDKQRVYDLISAGIPKMPSTLANKVNDWLDYVKSVEYE